MKYSQALGSLRLLFSQGMAEPEGTGKAVDSLIPLLNPFWVREGPTFFKQVDTGSITGKFSR